MTEYLCFWQRSLIQCLTLIYFCVNCFRYAGMNRVRIQNLYIYLSPSSLSKVDTCMSQKQIISSLSGADIEITTHLKSHDFPHWWTLPLSVYYNTISIIVKFLNRDTFKINISLRKFKINGNIINYIIKSPT